MLEVVNEALENGKSQLHTNRNCFRTNKLIQPVSREAALAVRAPRFSWGRLSTVCSITFPGEVRVLTRALDYEQIILRDMENTPQHAATGTANTMLSNRVSFWLNAKGPSMSTETGCSSSLLTILQACESLTGDDKVPMVSLLFPASEMRDETHQKRRLPEA